MIIRVLLIFIVVVFLLALARLAWLRRGAGVSRSPIRLVATIGLAALILLVVIAVASGRLHWLVSVPAALFLFILRALRFVPLMQLLRMLGLGGSGGPGGGTGPTPWGGAGGASGGASAGGQSRMETRHLDMSLDHENGTLDGTIREGAHAGARLSDLGLPELLALYRAWLGGGPDADGDSARLLETYLDRREGPAWRGPAGADGGQGDGRGDYEGEAQRTADGTMRRDEALELLGLEGEPDADTVIRAHRRLMQQFHPDRGGSDYLAALINRARARLLEDIERQ